MSKKRNNQGEQEPNKRRKDNNGHILVINSVNKHYIFDSSSDSEDSQSQDYSDINDSDDISESCPGELCDHNPKSKNIRTPPVLNKSITLEELIELGRCYHCKKQRYVNELCLYKLALMLPSLIKLSEMIGMIDIKKTFAEQIIYFLLGIEKNPKELLHTIIKGPPGVGKSHVIDIIADIYSKMGFLENRTVTKVKLTDLKAEYVGHTAIKTQQAIDKAMGGVFVIDEAYSIGSDRDIDSFSKEIIDVLNQNLTERCGEFICVIAGYGDKLESCLFSHNPGLKSRFRFTFNISGYSSSELYKMFKTKLEINNLSYNSEKDESMITKFFSEKHKEFKAYGRDIDSLIFHIKIANSIRMFISYSKSNIGIITFQDVKDGYTRFSQHNEIFEDKNQHLSLYL